MVMIHPRKHSFGVKGLTVGLISSLLYSSIAPSFAEANIWEERKQALEQAQTVPTSNEFFIDGTAPSSKVLRDGAEQKKTEQPWEFSSKAEFPAVDPKKKSHGFDIPPELGRIMESYTPEQPVEGSPQVIHIQDAHGYVDAQKN